MTSFEKYLIEKGYIMYSFDVSEMQYVIPKRHNISTMGDLGYIYIHKSDLVLLDKINNGTKVVGENSITFKDRKNEIVFGLHEKDRPTTLISPRPNIKVKRLKEGIEVIETEVLDDSMNVVLSNVSYDEILKAMYDKSICFEFDFTKSFVD